MAWDLWLAVLAGIVGSLIFHAGLARKVYNLQCDLSVTQAQLLREKNSRAALSRSKDKESLEVLRELTTSNPPAKPLHPLQKFGITR